MTLQTAVVAAVVVCASSSAWAQTVSTSIDTPIVRVGLFRLNGEGAIVGSATGTAKAVGEELGSTIYMAPCSTVGAGRSGLAISSAATDVWKITGTILELTPDHASLQVGWQRLRRDGQEETSAPQILTLTVKRGERTTLETISVPARGSCEGHTASLDVAFVTTSEMMGSSASAAVRAGRAGTSFTRTRGDADGIVVVARSDSYPTTVRADLWLVRTSPGHPDGTFHVTSPVMGIPRPFAFGPLTISSPNGTMTVKVQGTVESGLTPTGEPRFYFSANRTTTFAPANRAARDSAPVVEGSTKTTVPMPGPEEVLSFELPPLRTPDGIVLPDKLSVRVKLTSETSGLAKPR